MFGWLGGEPFFEGRPTSYWRARIDAWIARFDTPKQALEEIDQEEYFQTCLDLVQGKSATLKEKNRFTKKAKLFRFASNRGFEPDLIHRILNMKDNT